jgi:rubrerythrin
MRTPGFSAEASLYRTGQTRRYTSSKNTGTAAGVVPAGPVYVSGETQYCCYACGYNADGSFMWCCPPCGSTAAPMSTDFPVPVVLPS